MANSYEPVTVYVTATGQVAYTSFRVDGVNPTLDVGQSLIDGQYEADDFYIPSGTPTARPVLLAGDDDGAEINIDLSVGVNQTIISGLPSGTVVSTDDDFYAVTSGIENLQVRAERGGEFAFELVPPFPYKPLTFTLVVSNAS